MRVLLVVVVVFVGCGPEYSTELLGQTCSAPKKTNQCVTKSTYAACEAQTWQEFPCRAVCGADRSCDLTASKGGDPCPQSWGGAEACIGLRQAITCLDGGWVQNGCVQGSFACGCTSDPNGGTGSGSGSSGGGGGSGVCCKHCGSTSKPCGDSCISNSSTCHTSGGCAC